jgi:hypothetical protein
MKPTKNDWRVDVKLVDGNNTPNYFEIAADRGFYRRASNKGFGITGFMAADDAALLGNARAMFDALNSIIRAKDTKALKKAHLAAGLLLEIIEKDCLRLQESCDKMQQENKANGGS